ncbi:MAG: HEAT repeat domain-containing protein [Saprospiraceae bacterium]|nr:HEAT repeat domain-containing protein [Saprospiraceae bacterium]
MNIEKIEDRMVLALEGALSNSEFETLMKVINENHEYTLIWKSYQEMYQDMEDVLPETPSSEVATKFHEWLDNYQEEKVINIAQKGVKKGPIMLWRKWAGVAAIFIGVLGFWSMYQSNRQVEGTLADMSKQMERLMEQQSTSERIKAIRVNFNPEKGDLSNTMIDVLIQVLNTDQSSNVRLAAVETLAQFMDKEVVREALIKHLALEEDGGVKLTIITILGQQKNEKIKTTLENIVNDDSQEKFVIDEAHMQLIRFDQIDI